MPLHPTVLWAQRKDCIYLTVQLIDITKPEINVKPESFHFKGKGEKEQNEYEADLEFYGPVDVPKSKQHLTPRNLTMIIYKKEEGFWPRLQKDKKKPNFLKVDFARWKDEDDEEEEGPEDPMGAMDFSSLMQQAGSNLSMNDMVRSPTSVRTLELTFACQ
ncbi:HSP20-like chaperone [Fennellomyces sp. T-0311]|nr:HSP20-like chaperone [Fennellomyces sp. T-0311]